MLLSSSFEIRARTIQDEALQRAQRKSQQSLQRATQAREWQQETRAPTRVGLAVDRPPHNSIKTSKMTATAEAPAPGPTSSSSKKALKGPTSFRFVTFSDVDHMRDATAISSIRRHAMKDIGRQRRKPKKKRFVEVPIEVPTDFNARTELVTAPKPAIGGGGVHTFFPIPVELDHVGKALLANST